MFETTSYTWMEMTGLNCMNSIHGMNGMYEKKVMKHDDKWWQSLPEPFSKQNELLLWCSPPQWCFYILFRKSKSWVNFILLKSQACWVVLPMQTTTTKTDISKNLVGNFWRDKFREIPKKPSEGSLPYVEISFGVDFRKQKFTSRGDTERRLSKKITFHVSMFVGRNLANQL